MSDLHPDIVRAIRALEDTKLGRRYDKMARKRYGVPGWKLAGKTVSAEFGGRPTKGNRNVVSSAGARGPAQFIPSTRAAYKAKYGVDAWKNDKSAIKALALHQLNTGVEGYNPGMPTYKDLVLGQKLNAADRRALKRGQSARGSAPTAKAPGVSLQSSTIPGQSFAAERDDARKQLLTGGPLNLNRLLAYKSQVNALSDVPATTKSTLKVTPGSAPTRTKTSSAKASGGHVSLAPGADRPGVKTRRTVISFAKQVSDLAGSPVKIGTGSNHNQMTVNGNVSDHWGGNAADIPATGKHLTRLGQAALIAAGMSPAKARKQRGGLYNINGAQIIFNTRQGGDHTNHLHINPPRRR